MFSLLFFSVFLAGGCIEENIIFINVMAKKEFRLFLLIIIVRKRKLMRRIFPPKSEKN
jgi:hypothetical protein